MVTSPHNSYLEGWSQSFTGSCIGYNCFHSSGDPQISITVLPLQHLQNTIFQSNSFSISNFQFHLFKLISIKPFLPDRVGNHHHWGSTTEGPVAFATSIGRHCWSPATDRSASSPHCGVWRTLGDPSHNDPQHHIAQGELGNPRQKYVYVNRKILINGKLWHANGKTLHYINGEFSVFGYQTVSRVMIQHDPT